MFHKIKTNIKSILFSNQCKKSLFFMLISFVIFSFGLDTTFAAAGESDESKLITDALSSLQYIAGIAGAVIGGLTAVISILLDPSWINGTLFNISTYIKDVWIFVSNVVYLIFAGLLIAISFMNIIGKGNGDIFELKKSLPRFIIGVLIVPFSWFIVQFVISMASILTVSVYAWPIETFEPRLSTISGEIEWCENWVMDIQGSLKSSNNDAEENDLVYDDVGSSSTSKGFFYCKTGKVQKSIKDILFMKKDGVYNIGGIIGIYTFGIMDVGSLDEFKKTTLENIDSVFQLSAKVLFDVAFVLVYLVILLALFLALFVRVVVLWIYMMASPIFGLLYFSSKGAGKLGEKFNFKEFFALAMVPVYVSAALSFGLMFLLIIGEGGKSNSFSANENVAAAAAAAASADTEYDLGSTKLTIKGAIADDKNKKNFLSSVAGGALGALGYIMMKLFGLAFLWMAVMAALRSSKITHSVVEPIEKLGDQVGKFAMDAPKFIPIPGTGSLNGGKNMSVGGLLGGIDQGLRMKMNGPRDEANKFAQKFAGTEESRKLNNDITAAIGKGADKWKDVLQNNEEKHLFMEKERLATELENAKVIGASELRKAKDENDFITKLTKINNDNMHLNGGTGLLGKKMNSDAETREAVGGGVKSGPSTPVTPANQNIKIDINNIGSTPGISKGENNNYSIGDSKELTSYIKEQYSKGELTGEELTKILKKAGLIGPEDDTQIKAIVKELTDLNHLKEPQVSDKPAAPEANSNQTPASEQSTTDTKPKP